MLFKKGIVKGGDGGKFSILHWTERKATLILTKDLYNNKKIIFEQQNNSKINCMLFLNIKEKKKEKQGKANTTTVIKLNFKYHPMSEGKIYIVKLNLEVLICA